MSNDDESAEQRFERFEEALKKVLAAPKPPPDTVPPDEQPASN